MTDHACVALPGEDSSVARPPCAACAIAPPTRDSDREALDDEHARHFARHTAQYDGRGGIAHEDHGGIWCGCGEWDSGPVTGTSGRPWRDWHAHVVDAVLAAARPAKGDAGCGCGHAECPGVWSGQCPTPATGDTLTDTERAALVDWRALVAADARQSLPTKGAMQEALGRAVELIDRLAARDEAVTEATAESCGHPNHGSDEHDCTPFTAEGDDAAEDYGPGCDCTELCSMGPTCPGGMLAGLSGSGCWRTPPAEATVAEYRAAVEKVRSLADEWARGLGSPVTIGDELRAALAGLPTGQEGES